MILKSVSHIFKIHFIFLHIILNSLGDSLDSITISIRFDGVKGQPYTRRYLKSSLVRSLYAVALQRSPPPPAAAMREFELTSRLPGAAKLSSMRAQTGEESNLTNAVVFMRWQ